MTASSLQGAEPLAIRAVTARAFRVPIRFALGTSAAVVSAVPLLLVDLQMAEGVTGRCYLFCYTRSGARAIAAHLEEAVEQVKGEAAGPQDLSRRLARRYALLGVTGTLRMALSALDAALWDAAAVAAGKPLAILLGASRRAIPAYDSRGLGLMDVARLEAEADALLAMNLRGIKLRLGYATLAEDIAAVRTVRRRIPGDVQLMVDYNQALTVTEAVRRGLALQHEGIAWLEEPVRHDDYGGNAEIARALDVPVQIGENFNGPESMLDAIRAGACDHVMPDLSRIGGVTGWMGAAGIAAARGIEVSSHLMPELSAHLLAATPTAHWIEYVDWADAILEEPVRPESGAITPAGRPGFGLAWSEDRLRHLEPL